MLEFGTSGWSTLSYAVVNIVWSGFFAFTTQWAVLETTTVWDIGFYGKSRLRRYYYLAIDLFGHLNHAQSNGSRHYYYPGLLSYVGELVD